MHRKCGWNLFSSVEVDFFMSEIDPLQLVHAGQKRFSNEGMVEKEKQQRKHKGKAKLMSGSTNSPKKNRK